MIAVIFQWAARRATDPKDVRRGKAEPGGDRPSPSEVGMCGVPSPVRAVHQHSLTREGERLIPMVFALPAVVDTPPGKLRELIFWVSPRGECCAIFPGCPPGENAVDFVPGCPPGENAVDFVPGRPPGENAVVLFFLDVPQARMLCNFSWPFSGGMLPDFSWTPP